MAGVKLVHFIQIYGETQTMSNYGRHKLIVFLNLWLLNLCLIFTFSCSFFLFPLFSTQIDTVFTYSEDGTAWQILNGYCSIACATCLTKLPAFLSDNMHVTLNEMLFSTM